LNAPAANVVEAALCLASPELVNNTFFGWTEAFHLQ
jgi:hypothetical protein